MSAPGGIGRCFAYIRVSTVRQEQHGVSLDAQREAIERYASRSGIEIAEWFTESQTAAKRGRKEFDRMLKLLRRGKADGVVIHKIDRSARNLRDWADFAELVDSGIKIHLAAEALDLSSRGGRLSADIQAVVAADFIRNLREETRKGFYGRLKQGFYPIRAPIGYLDNGGGQLKTIDPQKGPLVREMFERYSTGEYTLTEITDMMRAAGLTNSFGQPVGINAVAGLLRNTFYMGLITIKKTGESFAGSHEALIPKSRFDLVQDVLAGRSRQKKHRHQFLFRRLITCGLCGRVLIAERQKGHAYYRCHARGCPTSCVREEEIEAAVGEQLRRIELTAEELTECYEVLSWLEGTTETLARDEAKRLALEIASTQDRLGRFTDLLIDGTLDRDTYEAKKRELLNRKLVLEEQRQSVIDDPTWAFDEVREILELAKSPLLSFELADPAEKRDIVELTTSNRTVTGKKPSVELREAFSILANRRSFLEGDPSNSLDRTLLMLSIDITARLMLPSQPTPMHAMIAELVGLAKRAGAAGEAG